MTKILGVSFGTKNGNNDSICKEALKGAQEAGCEVEFIRAMDLNIKHCTGCITCVKMLMSGQAGLKDLGGPVMIVQQMSEVAEESANAYYAFLNLMYFGAFIAINLAVMNMLPIPALDGGRVVCLLLTTAVEAVTRKKIDPKYEGYLHGIGMILLLILMAVIMFKDIIVWVRG